MNFKISKTVSVSSLEKVFINVLGFKQTTGLALNQCINKRHRHKQWEECQKAMEAKGRMPRNDKALELAEKQEERNRRFLPQIH